MKGSAYELFNYNFNPNLVRFKLRVWMDGHERVPMDFNPNLVRFKPRISSSLRTVWQRFQS